MEPIIGLDVSKGISVAQAFAARNTPFGKAMSIVQTSEGYEQLAEARTERQNAAASVHAHLIESDRYSANIAGSAHAPRRIMFGAKIAAVAGC